MINNSRVAIFGAGGLIGRAISEQLKNSGYTDVMSCTHQDLELTNQKAVHQFFQDNAPQYVFFCAVKSITDFESDNRPDAEELQNNLLMICHVVECAQKYLTKKAVFLGSAMLYPWEENHKGLLTEESLLERPNLQKYRISMESAVLSKYVSMKLCQYYQQQYGCNFVYVIPAHIYGGFANRKNLYFLEKIVQSICAAKIRNADSLYLDVFGEGKALKQFLHVKDCADAIIKVMQFYEDYGVPINIASNKPESWSSIVQMICEIVNYKGRINFNSARKEDLTNRLCSTEKLKSMGWKQKITMKAGLESLCKEYMEMI